jgi:hypothetical protein
MRPEANGGAFAIRTIANRTHNVTAVAAIVAPAPAPAPSSSPGPCAQGAIASIVDRPGVGRTLAVNGSPCVVPAGGVVLETGMRSQVTAGSSGVSTLSVFPQALLRWGASNGNELVVAPPLYSQRTGANLGSPFVPATGMQDVGIGYKRQLHDRAASQDAIEAFATFPTGYPGGPNGFTTGAPTYLLGYSLAVALGPIVSLTTTQNVVWAGFASYQPSLGISIAVGARGAVLLQDQVTTPVSATGGSGNRVVVGIQRSLSPNVVLDAEYEVNALPVTGLTQHAFGGGAAVRF